MKRTTLPSLALLSLLVLLGLTLAAGGASAQFDRADISKPIVVNNTANTPHGGGDPDNPVPVVGPEQYMVGSEEIEYREEIYGLPAEERFFSPLLPFTCLVKGSVASILLF